jgi:hypothetical protein
MPLTWFAHQAPVIGLKLARPRWFDATALCVGSMMPDLMYSFSSYVDIDTHRWPPAFTYGVPLSVVMATVIRFVVAPVAASQVPDLGTFRMHSFAVLSRRRPALWLTIVCAFLGIGSHIVVDWFTHPGRPGTRWLGYDDVVIHMAGRSESLAGVLQLVGHTFGSLFGLWLVHLIGRRRLLDEWYGTTAVEQARTWRPTSRQRVVFWLAVACGTIGGMAWGSIGDWVETIHRSAMGVFAGVVLGSVATRRPVPPELRLRPSRARESHTPSPGR